MPTEQPAWGPRELHQGLSCSLTGLGSALEPEQDLPVTRDEWLALVLGPLSLPGHAPGVPEPRWGLTPSCTEPQRRLRGPGGQHGSGSCSAIW